MKTTLAIVFMLLVATPVSAADREHQQLAADLRMLQEQAQQLAITFAALNDVLKAVNARLDQQTETSRKAFADQKLLVDNMSADLRVIRERTDETNVRISTLGQEMEALRTSVAAIPVAAPPAAEVPFDPNAPPGTTPAPGPVGSVPSTMGLSPTRMYETAFADYAAGQWSLAIQGFDTFLKTFPKSEMADDAQFYIGETHYSSGKYADAVAAYNAVIQTYQNSNSTPLAYYKRGLAQERMDQGEAARASWEFVIKNYPDSEAGRLAKQNLDRLGTRKPE
jgi:tol-pal system protein YbgF